MKLLYAFLVLSITSLVNAQEVAPVTSKTGIANPPLTAEELSKVLFSASDSPQSTPPQMNYRAHNGLKDKWITGLLIATSTADSDKKPLETEVYVEIRIPPLNTVQGSASYFLPLGSTAATKFTLREVKYSTDLDNPVIIKRRLVPAATN